MISRDTFVVLGQAAGQTSRMSLFPAVTNPFTRHASVLAGAIQTVEEMAPGRVKFVIGTGYTSASTIGRKPATLAEMRACISEVKTLLAGGAVDWGGGARTELAFASKRPIPILMAASGPRAIELAGEVADGALLLVGFNRGIVETALGHLERGARRAGRRLEDLEIVWAVRTGTAATLAEARRQARPTAVHWGILRWGGQWLEPAGLRLPPLEIPDAVHQIYPDLSHAQDWDAAIRATIVRAGRRGRPALRCHGADRNARALRRPDRRDDRARRAQPLPHAVSDLRRPRAGSAGVPGRRLPQVEGRRLPMNAGKLRHGSPSSPAPAATSAAPSRWPSRPRAPIWC